MINKIKENKFLILNTILTILLLNFLCLFVNKYSILYVHGYIYPWSNLHWRLPAQILETTLNNFLPNILSINPNDFRSGYQLGAIILYILFIIICFLFAKGFFLSEEKKENILKKKELLILLPLTALLMLEPILDYGIDTYVHIYRFNDLAGSAEYFFNLIPLLIFIFSIYDITQNTNNINKKTLFLYSINSFITGYYNELTNLTSGFFCFLFLMFCAIKNKKEIKNKKLFIILIPFCVGFICYYSLSGTTITGIDNYGISLLENIATLKNNFDDILSCFTQIMIIKKGMFYLIIILLFSFLVKTKTKSKNRIIAFSISLFFAYIFTNFCTIIFYPQSPYLFERLYWDRLYVNILELIIIILFGALYQKIEFKKSVTIILILGLLISCHTFKDSNLKRENLIFDIKKTIYQIDKTNLIYSVLGETAILPEKLLNSREIQDSFIFFMNSNTDYKERLCKNNYINKEYYFYDGYFETIYKQKYIGAIYKDNDFAEKELETRLKLFDLKKETDEELKAKTIWFKDIQNKFKGLKLTIEDIDRMEKKVGELPILDKARAYIYFNNKQYDDYFKLYSKYLVSYPDDIDSLLHIAEIHTINGNYKQAEKIYKDLIIFDDKNLLFKHRLICLYFYNLNKIDEAIEINKQIIELVPNSVFPYKNMFIFYEIIEKKQEAKQYLELAKEKDSQHMDFFVRNTNFENIKRTDIYIDYPW